MIGAAMSRYGEALRYIAAFRRDGSQSRHSPGHLPGFLFVRYAARCVGTRAVHAVGRILPPPIRGGLHHQYVRILISDRDRWFQHARVRASTKIREGIQRLAGITIGTIREIREWLEISQSLYRSGLFLSPRRCLTPDGRTDRRGRKLLSRSKSMRLRRRFGQRFRISTI